MDVENQDPIVPTLFMIPLVQFFAGLLLLAGLLHGQRDLIILTLLVLILYSGVKLWTRISLSGIACRFEIDRQKVFPDDKITVWATAENRKLLPVRLQIKVPLDGSLTPSSGQTALSDESILLWHQRTHFLWELIAQRRGVHRIGPSLLLAGDLFGFLARGKREETLHEVVVYPRLVPLKAFSLPKSDFFGLPGAKSPVQDPVYILGTRDYQHGRPAKHIHWKASARHDRLQEKLFEPTAQEKVLLLVDVGSFAKHNAEEAFERTLEAAASLAVRLDLQNCAVGLLTNGVTAGAERAMEPVSRNPRKMSAVLELLARLQMKTRADLMDLLCSGVEMPAGIGCVHFSYEEDETLITRSSFFGHRRIPVTFFVCEPCSNPGGHSLSNRHRVWSLGDLVNNISLPL